MNALPVLLFVDDEERILRSLRMLFRGRAEILATTSGAQAVELVRQRRVHAVVSDQRMPGMGGVEVLREVARHSPVTMRMLLTGYADMDAVAASVNEGEVYRFLEKPWDGPALVETVLEAARIAADEFAALDAGEPAATVPPAADADAERDIAAAHVLVLDPDGGSAELVRQILPASIDTQRAGTVEAALDALAERDFAVLVTVLESETGDIVNAIKRLKRLRPSTLVIAISPLRDSRLVIGLINEGQIFRFLLAPPGRELLRRCLIAAMERHAQLRSTPRLQRRPEVQPRSEPTIAGRLLDVWRRLKDARVR